MNSHLLSRFLRDRRGNVMIMFALLTIPVILGVGVAVDLSNATRVRLALQDATDSAVLALARDGMNTPPDKIAALAKRYIDASYNYNDIPYTIGQATFDPKTVTATLITRAEVPTTFMSIAGFTAMPVNANAVSKGLGFEIAMVLDNSGSMDELAGGKTKISALKEASRSFVQELFGASAASERFRISIVPFSASVNVGPQHRTSGWMDTGAASSIHGEDFANKTQSRFALFDQMTNAPWRGCVISRPAPYDSGDDAPSGGDRLFVPWFAPDEPDIVTGVVRPGYPNRYLSDVGGDCKGKDKTAGTEAEAQARTCKYKGATIAAADLSAGRGPNFNCTTPAITALTKTRGTLEAAINGMGAAGNTNILEGLAWGWRSLSPTQPFPEGKAYDAPNNRKVIVLMTDGQNFIGGQGNRNLSNYHSYGYMAQKRLNNPGTSSESANRAKMDERTLAACTKAKAQKIVIYTIGFGTGAKGSANMLRACATSPEYFYTPVTAAELTPVFRAIAQSITGLRISN